MRPDPSQCSFSDAGLGVRIGDAALDECRRGPQHVSVHMLAPAARFVALVYDDPPGGHKTCLNTKLASCTVRLAEPGRPTLTLTTPHRAAFEMLTDANDHAIPLSA